MTVDSTGHEGAAPEPDDWPPDARIFTIRAVADDAVPSLAAELPISATELGTLDGDADHPVQFCSVLLEPPVKHRFETADAARYEREYCDRDDDGEFFMVHVALLGPRRPGVSLAPGARDALVDVAYVVDLSLEEDGVLNPAKVDWAGGAIVDVEGGVPAEQATPADLPTVSEQTPVPVPAASAPEPGSPGSSEWIREQLDVRIAVLSRLAGEVAISEVPVPTELAKGERQSNTAPQYVLDGAQFWYHTRDPKKGFVWKTTNNPNELIYWCIDDVARGLAWRWTQQTATYKTMPPAMAQRTLWAPYWQLLMNALDTKWGAITGRNIRDLL
ncbi:Uncharacterised protein [Mycolicibacterium phlei]|uniref:Uncharacterized protein n=1 Tax=Mycobacteroides chelonae TaxID=1774 RepID=A0A0E3TQD4_MYCCH|nr:immunity 63 family protein [Mycobacteroides chelonae]AMW18667.1 hypothetical protein Chelonae_p0916 [Mycobacterium sp. QIA-37]VEG15183.1 Uncharacterised protein [Mycolicibacterium phlei]AKC38005.1 hypothetical protein GR01_04690 [Mycobacteroides chelonae]ANA97194.1 hypothetical protein BB28_05110 [Mycobacteroides chelonae CCUG 47445]AYM41040.1 hypothetical protein DYE20_05300 [[Mycobacterium] chelonae subsp. gwanakae]